MKGDTPIDGAIRYLCQAQSIAVLLSDPEALENLNSAVVENAFWLLLDRLKDVEGELYRLSAVA